MNRPEYMLEDRVWYIPPGAKFAVLATVIGVSRAIEFGSFYFYDIDEPTGHSLPEDELMLEKYRGDIPSYVKENIEEYSKHFENIQEWRKSQVDFIYSTHVKAYGDKAERWGWMKEDYYPERSKDEIICA